MENLVVGGTLELEVDQGGIRAAGGRDLEFLLEARPRACVPVSRVFKVEPVIPVDVGEDKP